MSHVSTFLALFLGLAVATVNAQTISWGRQFGTAASDSVYAVAADATEVYVAGSTRGALDGSNAGLDDAFVRKYDANGNLQWARQFGTAFLDLALAIVTDATGVYVAGYTGGALDGSNAGAGDAFVRKYDANGTPQWTKQFGTASGDGVWGVAVNATGVYVAGWTDGALGGSSAGGQDVFVRKYDANGNLLWTKQFGTASGDGGYALAADATGVYVAGSTYGALDGSNAGDADAFVRKYDANGTPQWTKQIGTAFYEEIIGIAADATGVYVAGSTYGSVDGSSAGSLDVFVRKYDANGTPQWTKQFGTASIDYANSIAAGPGGIYVAGFTYGALDGGNAGEADAFVRKYNANGTPQWTKQFGTAYSEYVSVAAGPGGIYVGGWTTGALFNSSAGGWDAFIASIPVSVSAYAALVQPPINPDGSSVFNVKRGVVPVKFTLTLNGLQTCALPPATISLQRIAGSNIGPIDESIYIQASNSGSNFRIDLPACQYIYNLGTDSLGPGNYRVAILINGATVGNATFSLK